MLGLIGKVAIVAAAFFLASPSPSSAQTSDYPNRLITLVVPFVPGGATDLIGRLAAQHLSKDLGHVIVDNRPGAAGAVGSRTVAKAAADGYTLLLGSTDTVVINAYLYKNLLFNPLADLNPVALVGDAPEVIAVSASLPFGNLREFIEQAHANPGKFNYGSPGIGTIPHLAGDRLARMIGTQMVHIPFRGSAAAMKEVATGQIQLSIATKASADPFLAAGIIKILAVASERRFDSLPDVPTTAEAGLPGYEIHNWWGVLAPQGTSPNIIARLNASLKKMFDDPATVSVFMQQGILPVRIGVNDFADRIRRDDQYWKPIVADSGVRIE